MPKQQIIPTWLAWNNCNFQTQSGITDPRTLQDFPAGGLNVGDYFDATEQEANEASYLANGLLHWGRYRLVKVDSGATVAHVRTGTIGYVRAGTFVQSASFIPGTGGTPGTYIEPLPAQSVGGSGAVLEVVVGNSGSIVSVTVLRGGSGYLYTPILVDGPPFLPPVPIPGLTAFWIAGNLNSTPNVVTSVDQAIVVNPGVSIENAPRAVVFLNSITPGNYGFVQELGLANVMCSPIDNSNPGSVVYPDVTDGTGRFGADQSVQSNSIGQNVDYANPNNLFKMYMMYVPVCQD